MFLRAKKNKMTTILNYLRKIMGISASKAKQLRKTLIETISSEFLPANANINSMSSQNNSKLFKFIKYDNFVVLFKFPFANSKNEHDLRFLVGEEGVSLDDVGIILKENNSYSLVFQKDFYVVANKYIKKIN